MKPRRSFVGTVKSPSGTTPPPTPLVLSRSILSPSSTTISSSNVFPSISMNGRAPISPTRHVDHPLNNWSLGGSGSGTSTTDLRSATSLYPTSKTTSHHLLAPPTTSFDRYFAEQRRLTEPMSRSSTSKIPPRPPFSIDRSSSLLRFRACPKTHFALRFEP